MWKLSKPLLETDPSLWRLTLLYGGRHSHVGRAPEGEAKPPLPMNRITDRSKNFTLPTTSFAGDKLMVAKDHIYFMLLSPMPGCLIRYWVMLSQVSVCLSTIGLMATRSLLVLVIAWSVCILLHSGADPGFPVGRGINAPGNVNIQSYQIFQKNFMKLKTFWSVEGGGRFTTGNASWS